MSHREAVQLLLDLLQKPFEGKLMYLHLPAWKSGLYSFRELLESEGTARQLICKDGGCRRQ